MKRCDDCKKRLWFWQVRGLDNGSHLRCHWQRCVQLRIEARGTKYEASMFSEVAEVEAFYRKHGKI